MSRARSKEVGEIVEELAIERHGLVGLDDESPESPDALAGRDTPIEIKACRLRIRNGGGETIPGRWYLRRRAHEALEEAGGWYLLVVYDESDGGELELVEEHLLPATIVGSLVSTWTDVRNRGQETVAKLSRTVVGEGSA